MVDLILPENTPTSVYKYFDRNNILIYVGITAARVTRQQQHNASKAWWPFVSHQEVEHFQSRDEARERERALIVKHRPPFNTQHNSHHNDIREAYVSLAMSGQLNIKHAAKILKRFAADGRRHVELAPVVVAGGTAFLTRPKDHAIASALGAIRGTPVLAGDSLIGYVKSAEVCQLVTRINVKWSQPEMANGISSATGVLKFVCLKEPNIKVGFRKICVDYRDRIPSKASVA